MFFYSEEVILRTVLKNSFDNSKTVTVYKSLGLTLASCASNWSIPVDFNFSSLPANARIIKFKSDHGPAKTGAPKLLGAILTSILNIDNP